MKSILFCRAHMYTLTNSTFYFFQSSCCRQFTQAGMEFLGCDTALADAEATMSAVDFLRAVGLDVGSVSVLGET